MWYLRRWLTMRSIRFLSQRRSNCRSDRRCYWRTHLQTVLYFAKYAHTEWKCQLKTGIRSSFSSFWTYRVDADCDIVISKVRSDWSTWASSGAGWGRYFSIACTIELCGVHCCWFSCDICEGFAPWSHLLIAACTVGQLSRKLHKTHNNPKVFIFHPR